MLFHKTEEAHFNTHILLAELKLTRTDVWPLRIFLPLSLEKVKSGPVIVFVLSLSQVAQKPLLCWPISSLFLPNLIPHEPTSGLLPQW
jgi:hypothetical protein